MGWVYLDDHFPEHPKIAAAGAGASWLYVCGLAYSNRNGTMGFIPKSVTGRLTELEPSKGLAKTLVDVGLWEPVDGGYRIHDYEYWNASAVRRSAAKQKASDHAKRAAWARWHPHEPFPDDDAQRNAQPMLEGMPEHPGADARALPEHSPGNADARMQPQAPIAITRGNVGNEGILEHPAAAAVVSAALRVIAERNHAARHRPADNPDGWIARAIAGLRIELADRLAEINPGDFETAEALADWLRPPRAIPEEDPDDGRRDYDRVRDHADCPDCGGSGWREIGEHGPGQTPDVVRCEHQKVGAE